MSERIKKYIKEPHLVLPILMRHIQACLFLIFLCDKVSMCVKEVGELFPLSYKYASSAKLALPNLIFLFFLSNTEKLDSCFCKNTLSLVF